MKEIVEKVNSFLDTKLPFFGDKIDITIRTIVMLFIVLLIASFLIKLFRRVVVRNLEKENKNKFDTIFSFGSWLTYIVIFLITLDSTGVNVTAIFAASAALLIGIGLALQTFFQDIISGIFIIIDQSVHVGDIIELDGKVGRVIEIRLRTTRAVTIDDKVIVIPNHLYLTKSLYNWTQNGETTRESITVGVAYGSDIELVKKLLIKAANEHPNVLKTPSPLVLFTNFGDSALQFKLIFTLNDSFQAAIPQSEIRFTIDKLFREHNITIPFPQRDVHVFQKKD